jgi:putative transposase
MIAAIAELDVQDASTRKVRTIVEELCGLEVTSSQVSRAAAELDEKLDAGLKAARQAVMTGVRWQRCQFHAIHSAMAHVPKVAMRPEVARDLRRVCDAAEPAEAERRLKDVVTRCQKTAPQLAAWLEHAIPEALAVLPIPAAHRRLRTTNSLAKLNEEIKPRTRVATLFPNEASLLRLASAVLSEISDDWETERAYLNMEAR